jgi:hypothetical protein
LSKNDADEAVSVVSLPSSSGGYINGRNSASLELLIDTKGAKFVYRRRVDNTMAKRKSTNGQTMPHHFWTYTSHLTTVVNSILKFFDKRDDFNFKIINVPNMCSNIPASPAYCVAFTTAQRFRLSL